MVPVHALLAVVPPDRKPPSRRELRDSTRPTLRHFEPALAALDGPMELAPRVHWVGHQLDGDPLQCHAYLIEHGDQSVLFDPGSALTFPHVRRKVEQILPFDRIRYFVCHHPDPDITGALPLIGGLTTRRDAVLVTHWRAAALLEHLAPELPFWLVDEHGWTLDLGGRVLQFVFTPYLHFPGAFCTFDEESGTLFSSDLFGGFARGPGLFVEDEGYFEDIRAFHEHYMPSREILLHGLLRLEPYPIRRIAPQHGRIIPAHLVRTMFDRLKGLDCGLYLLTERDSDIRRLMLLSTMLEDVTEGLVNHQDFATLSRFLLARTQAVLPVESLAFYVDDGPAGLRCFAAENHYRGAPATPPQAIRDALGTDRERWRAIHGSENHAVLPAEAASDPPSLLLPLFSTTASPTQAAAVFRLAGPLHISAELDGVLGEVSVRLAIAVERQALCLRLEQERDRLYELSTRDALTGLYTRRYLDDAGRRLVEQHHRDPSFSFALIMLDVDFFKRVNDTHGHPVGDAVLEGLGAVLAGRVRYTDVAARYGGEEFAVLLPAPAALDGLKLAEDLLAEIAARPFEGRDGAPLRVTVSAGVALHRVGESLTALVARADRTLYEAKASGRNRVFLSV